MIHQLRIAQSASEDHLAGEAKPLGQLLQARAIIAVAGHHQAQIGPLGQQLGQSLNQAINVLVAIKATEPAEGEDQRLVGLEPVALEQGLWAGARGEAVLVVTVGQHADRRAAPAQLLPQPLGREAAHGQQPLQPSQAPAGEARRQRPHINAMGTAPVGGTGEPVVQPLQRREVWVGGEEQAGPAAAGRQQGQGEAQARSRGDMPLDAWPAAGGQLVGPVVADEHPQPQLGPHGVQGPQQGAGIGLDATFTGKQLRDQQINGLEPAVAAHRCSTWCRACWSPAEVWV